MRISERFAAEIEAFLKESGMNATAFGRAAVGDPSFVGDLRKGRKPNLGLVDRVEAFIETRRRDAAKPPVRSVKVCFPEAFSGRGLFGLAAGQRGFSIMTVRGSSSPPVSILICGRFRRFFRLWITAPRQSSGPIPTPVDGCGKPRRGLWRKGHGTIDPHGEPFGDQPTLVDDQVQP